MAMNEKIPRLWAICVLGLISFRTRTRRTEGVAKEFVRINWPFGDTRGYSESVSFITIHIIVPTP